LSQCYVAFSRTQERRTPVMSENNYDQIGYYYGTESTQFAFYQMPKELVSNPVFSVLSMDAKFLYCIILDRMHLSYRNRWVDDKDRVYIILKLSEVAKLMNCGLEKAGDLMAELDNKTTSNSRRTIVGFGLIERVRRGQGNPDLIFVKKYTDFLESPSDSLNLDNPDSRNRIIRNPESGKPGLNNNENKETKNNNTLHPSAHTIMPPAPSMDREIDHNNDANLFVGYDQVIRDNINMDLFIYKQQKLEKLLDTDEIAIDEYNARYAEINPTTVNQVLQYMVDVVASPSNNPVVINERLIPREIIRSKLLKIDHNAMCNCIKQLNRNKKIKNPKNYAISMLYNS